MARVDSAGILLWRRRDGQLEVFIAHMGGPFWGRKDDHAWSIPKGEYESGEPALVAAKREFLEEVGVIAPAVDYLSLGEFRQSSGKVVTAFAAESDLEVPQVNSNTFALEWPPRSGNFQDFPEIDRVEWMSVRDASRRLVMGQLPILAALERSLVPDD
ncbi:MAG TPA: NUDIX domain-containing protein [Galbitalea sp.]